MVAGRCPVEEDTNMRKSIIAGLTLAAALTAFAAPSQAQSQAPQGAAVELASLTHKTTSHKPVGDVRRQPARTAAETGSTLFRIPAHPVVRDCVHVFFPQCGRGYDGLNDGTWGRY
jgi:hypothetical protein